jgi:hypothetical protein
LLVVGARGFDDELRRLTHESTAEGPREREGVLARPDFVGYLVRPVNDEHPGEPQSVAAELGEALNKFLELLRCLLCSDGCRALDN